MKHININRKENRKLRHKRITNRFKKNSLTSFRLVVSKTNGHIYAQLIDDVSSKTLASSSSLQLKKQANMKTCKLIGEDMAKKIKDLNIINIHFDRGGNKYHGQVKVIADTLREMGVKL